MGVINRSLKFPSLHKACYLFSGILLCLFCWSGIAEASPLSDRIASFPHWLNKPIVQPADGDLIYPDWFAGTWEMSSTLIEMVAPLEPDVVTPGFESNRQYLNQPVISRVRFVPASSLGVAVASVPLTLPLKALNKDPIVADRAFNGLNLARAYLGNAVLAVEVDPITPNRQVTTLQGERQLVSVITGRNSETPEENHFLTSELFQQVFRGSSQPYLNQVETTTDYHYLKSEQRIVANQITAIYLSPQDPQFFKVGDTPIALYRYRLELAKG